jgi:hypothetical protein
MTHAEIDDLPVGTPVYWAKFLPGTNPIMEVVTCRVEMIPPRSERFIAYTDGDAKFLVSRCFEVHWVFPTRQEALEALRRRVDDRISQLAELRENLR